MTNEIQNDYFCVENAKSEETKAYEYMDLLLIEILKTTNKKELIISEKSNKEKLKSLKKYNFECPLKLSISVVLKAKFFLRVF